MLTPAPAARAVVELARADVEDDTAEDDATTATAEDVVADTRDADEVGGCVEMAVEAAELLTDGRTAPDDVVAKAEATADWLTTRTDDMASSTGD